MQHSLFNQVSVFTFQKISYTCVLFLTYLYTYMLSFLIQILQSDLLCISFLFLNIYFALTLFHKLTLFQLAFNGLIQYLLNRNMMINQGLHEYKIISNVYPFNNLTMFPLNSFLKITNTKLFLANQNCIYIKMFLHIQYLH